MSGKCFLMPELPWVLDELFLTIQVDWAVDELFLAIQVDWAVDELFLQLNLTRSPFSKLRQILHRLRNSLARQKPGELTLKQSSPVKFVSRFIEKAKRYKD